MRFWTPLTSTGYLTAWSASHLDFNWESDYSSQLMSKLTVRSIVWPDMIWLDTVWVQSNWAQYQYGTIWIQSGHSSLLMPNVFTADPSHIWCLSSSAKLMNEIIKNPSEILLIDSSVNHWSSREQVSSVYVCIRQPAIEWHRTTTRQKSFSVSFRSSSELECTSKRRPCAKITPWQY